MVPANTPCSSRDALKRLAHGSAKFNGCCERSKQSFESSAHVHGAMQAARHRWPPLYLRIQHLDEQSQKKTRRPQGVVRAARSTLLARLQNETSTIERPISSGYARRGNPSRRGVRSTEASSLLRQQTRRRASHLSGSALSAEVACRARRRNPSNPTKLVSRKRQLRHLPGIGTSFWSLR